MSDHTYKNFNSGRRYLQGDPYVDRASEENATHDAGTRESYFNARPRFGEQPKRDDGARFNGYRYDGTYVEADAASHAGKGPKNYRRSDERVREDACDSLMLNASVDASDVEVSVTNGVVTLEGTVPTRNQKRMAEDAVMHLAGVIDVENRLKIAAQN